MKIKFQLFFAMILLFVSHTNTASAQIFTYETRTASIGYGWPNLVGSFYTKYKSYPNYSLTSQGPFFGKIEFSVAEKMSMGACVDISKATLQYYNPNGGYYSQVWSECTSWSILARFNYHFFDSDEFDPYAGAGVGYRYNEFDYRYVVITNLQSYGKVAFEVTAGIRYFFMDNMALYIEAGYAKAPLQGGAVLKF